MGCGEPDLQLFRSCRISISFDDELAQWHVGQGPSLKSYTSYTMELVLHQFRTCAEHAQNTHIIWVAQNMRNSPMGCAEHAHCVALWPFSVHRYLYSMLVHSCCFDQAHIAD